MIRWRFLETVALDLKTETEEKGDVVQTNGCGLGAVGWVEWRDPEDDEI